MVYPRRSIAVALGSDRNASPREGTLTFEATR
jgi:hypothetical protein